MEDVRDQYRCDLPLTVYLAGPRVNFSSCCKLICLSSKQQQMERWAFTHLLLRLNVLINFFDKKEYPTIRGYYWIKGWS